MVLGKGFNIRLTEWLFPQLEEEEEGKEFIFQQYGAPLHWHLHVQEHLNEQFPGRWIEPARNDYNVSYKWPSRSPDLTVCDFFLWGLHKGLCLCTPIASKPVRNATSYHCCHQSISWDMLERMWREWEYCLDVCSITRGDHIQCLWGIVKIHLSFSFECH